MNSGSRGSRSSFSRMCRTWTSVVRPELEAEHLVELVVPGGQHDDRHGALRPQPLAHLEPVELRQHQVEHDEVDRLVPELAQRLLAVARLDDAEAVALERVGEEL